MTEECYGHEVPCTSNDTCERGIMDDEVQRELPSKYVTDHKDCEGGTYVFYPTWEEFKDFSNYIRLIENTGAHLKSGIAKIIPPKGWSPRPSKNGNYEDVEDYVIYEPVKERIQGAAGAYTKFNTVYRKQMTVAEYRKLAESDKFRPPVAPEATLQEIERAYWRGTTMLEPIYGADTPGSLYDEGVKEWNITDLGTILDLVSESGVKIKGVNTAYLYLGMWKTTFPWHVEDMDLYSINYVHYGAPKFWYGIAEKYADRMEQLCASFFPESFRHCKQFLRHKMHLLSPEILRNHGIPFTKCLCRAGEFMITFPRGFHAGFNVGYNCAESTNFATPRWVMIGANAKLCECRDDIVRIDMRPFVKRYRPFEYEEWHKYWFEERVLNITFDDEEAQAVQMRKRRSKAHHDRAIIDVQENKEESNHQQNAITEPEAKRPRNEAVNDDDVDLRDEEWLSYFDADKLYIDERDEVQWKHKMHRLWSDSGRVELQYERMLNEHMSGIEPFCAVCQYFVAGRSTDNDKTQKKYLPLRKRCDRVVRDYLLCSKKSV